MQVIIFFVTIIFLINPAFSKNLYYSKEYNIKFISDNIKLKKEEAINNIKHDSFRKIINSILTNNDYLRLNEIINIDLINTFLFSLDIYEEKINNNNYSSKLKIAYDGSKIIDYFITNNFKFIPYESEKFLIIIFDQRLSSEKLLSKDNRFYKYLYNNKKDYDLFIIPKLDINDRFIIKQDDFFLKKIIRYDELISKYSNDNILLVHSISKLNEVKINSYAYKDNKFNLIHNISFEEINFKIFFENLQFAVLDYWKKTNNVGSLKMSNIDCRIQTLNLIELKKIKEIVSKNNMIKKINFNEISYNNSVYNITYLGSLEILIKSLQKAKIQLELIEENCKIRIL